MTIPIQNIYYLLCYAWNKLEEDDKVEQVRGISFDHYADLFAMVLNNGCNYLFKRGLDREYVLQSQVVAGVKGKIDFTRSIHKNLFVSGQAVCEFDDFSYDVLHNQIIKATLRKLANIEQLSTKTRKELLKNLSRLSFISDRAIALADFSKIRLHRNNQFYDFLLKLCRIVHEDLFIEKGSGSYSFRSFIEDERKMAYLFQEFIKNFFRKEQAKYEVNSKKISWHLTAPACQAALGHLPKMNPDIVLQPRQPGIASIIIDTKFYKEALKVRYDKEQIISAHLYQVYAYVQNWQAAHPNAPLCQGMLLYPTVTKELDLNYQLGGHNISVRTINLNQPCQQLRADILELLQ